VNARLERYRLIGKGRRGFTAILGSGTLIFSQLHSGVLQAETSGVDPASKPVMESYSVFRMGVEAGLPEGIVTSLAQMQDGYLWLTTPGAVARFDGLHFLPFREEAYPDERPQRLNSIMQDRSGNAWVSGENGIMRHDGSRWKSFPHETLPLPPESGWRETPDGAIRSPTEMVIFWVKESRDGTLWAASNAGFLKFDGNRFVSASADQSVLAPFDSAALDDSGTLWAVCDQGLFRFEDSAWSKEDFPSQGEASRPYQVFSSGNGTVWVKRLDGPLFGLENGKWIEVPPPGLRQSAILKDSAGDLWIGAAEGLFRKSREEWEVVVGLPFEAPTDVRCLAATGDGSIWAGTSAGLYQLRPRIVHMIPCATPSRQSNAVTAVLPKSPHELWVGLATPGLLEGPPRQLSLYAGLSTTEETRVSALGQGRPGILWAGFQGNHLWKIFIGKNNQMFRTANSLMSRNITCILQDSKGHVWVGTREGLLVMKDQWLTPVKAPSDTVLDIAEHPQGDIWVGTQTKGLWKIRKGEEVFEFTQKEGLPSDTIRGVEIDSNGTIWLITPKGLVMFEEKQNPLAAPEYPALPSPDVFVFGSKDGLPSEEFRQILDDNHGNLWLGTRSELVLVKKADLIAIKERRSVALNPRVFGKEAGLDADLSGGDHGPFGARLADDTLWFATSAGLAGLAPLRLPGVSYPGEVMVHEIAAGDEPLDREGRARAGELMTLPLKTRDVAFAFTSPEFAAPERLRFRYRLEGLDPEWSFPSTGRSAVYVNLPPGSYQFHVEASSPGGEWRGASSPVSFSIPALIWETWPFRMALGGIVLASVALVSGLVVRRRAARKLEAERLRSAAREQNLERQKALENERTRIARDIHDDVGSSLTRILLLSKSARLAQQTPDGGISSKLASIEATAMNLCRGMDEIVWAVNPTNDTLDALLSYLGRYAEEFLRESNVRCRIDFPLDVPERPVEANVRHAVFLAFKEAINNAVKHSASPIVRISARILPSGFELLVDDEGKGCPCDPLAGPAVDARARKGSGLGNMKARLAGAGGNCYWEPNHPKGCRVRLVVGEKE